MLLDKKGANVLNDLRRAKTREREAIEKRRGCYGEERKERKTQNSRREYLRAQGICVCLYFPKQLSTQIMAATYSEPVLPGQPITLASTPWPQLGQGLYLKDNQIRASRVGIPHRDGSVS